MVILRAGIPVIAGFGEPAGGFVRGRRIDSIRLEGKRKSARARIERARTALCRSIGFGTRRRGFVRGSMYHGMFFSLTDG